jgi:hypothetical protein
MKNKPALILGVLFAIGLVFIGCKDAGAGGGTPAGTLTINGAPSYASTVICDYTMPASRLDYITAVTRIIAMSQDNSSPYALISTAAADAGAAFTKGGTFLVVLRVSNAEVYLKGGVGFSNGSATVNFDDMVLLSTLP